MTSKGLSRKRHCRRVIIFLAALLLSEPVIQVLWVRWVNPSTTTPAILRNISGHTTPVRFKWIEWKAVSVDLREAMLIGEGATFFEEGAFDWVGIRNSVAYAWRNNKRVLGASTITQQCARSLFLWQGRSWIRKVIEAYYAFWMDAFLSKQRILELYSNVIELGEGVYGIEAGAEHHFGLPASDLNRSQIASLIAIMPNPRVWNPNRLTRTAQSRAQMILTQLNQIHGDAPTLIIEPKEN